MANEAKFIINGQDKTAAAMASAKKNLGIAEQAADALASKLMGFASITALSVLAVKVGQFASTCVKEFATAERAQLRLQAALGDGTAFDRAMSTIDELGRKYNGSKDDIEGVVSALAALGKSTDQIDAITRASVNLSNTTGQDLNSSYLLLADTFEGKVSAKLQKLLPGLGDLSEAQLKAGGATDLINEKLQAMTDKLAEGTAQKVTNLAEAFGDLKENVGQDAANLMSPMIEWLEKVITRTNDAITASRLHQKVMKEGANAALSDQLQDKKNQLSDAQGKVKTAKATYQASDFESWLQNKKRLDPENYSDKSKRKQYNFEYSNLIVDLEKSLNIPELEKTIADLNKQIKKNSEQLETPKPTPVVAAGAGAVSGVSYPSGDYQGAETAKDAGWVDKLLVNIQKYQPPAPTGPTDIGMSGIGGWGDLFTMIKDGIQSKIDGVKALPGNIAAMPGKAMDAIGNISPVDVFQGMVGGLDSFITSIGSVIGSFSMIKQIMDPVGIILQGIMDVLAPIIESLLTPLIGILRIFGQLIGMFIAPALRMLTPVITFITKAFIFLYNNALVPVQNFFISMIETIGNFFIRVMNGIINALNKIPGVNIKKGKEMDLSGSNAEKINMEDIMAAGGGASAGGSGGSGSGSGSGASYTGVKDITINIYYQNSYVNGDARAIAMNLRSEIKAAEALGY